MEISGNLNAAGLKFAVVVARFNEFFSSKLLEGALDCLKRHGANDNDIAVVRVPGSFEIPYAASRLAKSKKYNAIICIGVVLRGNTPHYEHVAAEVTKGIARLGLEFDIPVVYGIVTADSLEQAIERSGSKSGNRGFNAAMTAIEMANLYKVI
ncbi:MAG: 6,7-dimethyl-8-ribityllumazine synthase [candidate division Zixibacteria bacterium]|nr:6,7-dimethyl-8-ribityllumazine synthase [candidate division Zixibacteria bacterium]